MIGQRIIPAVAVAAVTLCAQASPAAASSTLLSGYGGPGQGNQAILGSTLIGGGKGTGGGASGGGSGSPRTPTSIALSQPAGAGQQQRSGASSPRHRHRGVAHRPHSGAQAKHAAPAYARATPAADRGGGGRTLGLTGADAVYIVLVLGALALTALLTVRLGRRTPAGQEGPHGQASR